MRKLLRRDIVLAKLWVVNWPKVTSKSNLEIRKNMKCSFSTLTYLAIGAVLLFQIGCQQQVKAVPTDEAPPEPETGSPESEMQ